jgi:hypothetical protein
VIKDEDITQQRLDALHGLPWALSSTTVLGMSAEDLDNLAARRHDEDAYWRLLNEIVTRIEGGGTTCATSSTTTPRGCVRT